MTRRSSHSTVKCNTRAVDRRTASLGFLLIWYIISEALLWRIARAVKREFRVLFFRTNQKSACKPASMIVGETHSLLHVCVSAYEQRIEAVLFNYRGLYRYRSRRKQNVNSLVPVPRGSQGKRSLQWCATLTPRNTKTMGRMTCHCFQWPIRRDLRISCYTTALKYRAFFGREHYRICTCKQEISSGTGTCF